MELFKKELQLYNQDSNTFKEYLDKYENIFNNKENLKISSTKWEAIYSTIEDNRKLLQEFRQTGNRELLKTAVQNEIRDIYPEIRNLRMMNDKIMELNENIVGANKIEHVLFKYPVLLSQTEEIVGEPARVIRFDV